MIDQEMKDQLKSVFSVLENQIEFVYQPTKHTDQSELENLLTSLTETSEKIKLSRDSTPESLDAPPQFRIFKNGKPTGVSFKGIPGGHEFTSLILAVLNADLKGKLPDEGIIQRVKNLKGPIRLKTYISLTCENCPDVVQALNLMSYLHSDFQHEMIDGLYAQDEITSLGIQGVPAVSFDSKILHSGKISFIDLLKKLEEAFGSEHGSSQITPRHHGKVDVAVIGGGPAGTSAAIYSARKGLSTTIIAEKFGGQVQDTMGIENLISIPYTEGPKLSAELIKHMNQYPIKQLEHRRVQKIDPSTKTLYFESGETLEATSIIIATGAKWRELNVPGEKEYLGRGVAFCPHCDGPFYKGKNIIVVGGGNSGVEAAIDLAGIVNHVTVVEFNSELKADKVLSDKLQSLKNTAVIKNAKTTRVLGDGNKVNALEYQDRVTNEIKQVPIDGIFVQIGLLPNSQFTKGLLEMTPHGEIVVDNKGRTSLKGIYAAGDVTTVPYKQIIIAMGEGAKAALASFEDNMLA